MNILESIIAYSAAAALLTVTPGLDTVLILRTSASEGTYKAFHVAAGISAGCFMWGSLVALGLGALTAISILAYDTLKWCGALYLLWLGIQLIRHPRSSFNTDDPYDENTGSWFLRGMLSNALNPKVGIFYVSFLPQFIPDRQNPVIWTFILVAIHMTIGLAWSSVLIITANKLSLLLNRQSTLKFLDRLTGGIFLLFAVKLIFSQ